MAVVSRSAVKPAVLGLGTAAILAAGSSSAVAFEKPSPSASSSSSAPSSPSSPSSPSTAPATLSVVVTAGGPAKAGTDVPVRTSVSTDTGMLSAVHVTSVKVTASSSGAKPTLTGGCPPPATAAACTLGKVTSAGKSVVSYLSVPDSLKKAVTVTVTVTVAGTDGDKAQTDSDSASVSFRPVVVPSKPPTSSKPTPTPTKSSPKPTKSPTPTPTPTHSSSGGTGGNTGGGNNTGGGTTGGGTTPTTGSGITLPNPNSSFQNPQVAPPIAQPSAPNPSVAPQEGATTPESRLRGNQSPVAQDLTFERMASTQIAWLAALLVAVALLLTQLRLGRRHSAAAAAARPKGTHRRTRRGMFGK